MPLQEWSAAQDVRHEARVVNARPVPTGFTYSLASRSHLSRNSGGGGGLGEGGGGLGEGGGGLGDGGSGLGEGGGGEGEGGGGEGDGGGGIDSW